MIQRCKDINTDWRYGIIYTYAAWSKKFTERLEHVTIRPDQSARKIEQEYAKRHGFRSQDVFLTCPGE